MQTFDNLFAAVFPIRGILNAGNSTFRGALSERCSSSTNFADSFSEPRASAISIAVSS